jgi:glycosyltransferase involved in cell wall biosynthesis
MPTSFDVSVVIPTYNREHLLPQTLASILEQSVPPAEVIIVDDGSTDGTEALARGFQPPIRYIRIENSGVCRARNVGASLATAPWIAFCDSDDLWHPDKLDAQVRLLRAVPGLEYAFTNFRVVTDGWSSTTKFDEAPPGYWDRPRRLVRVDAFVVDVPLFERVLTYNPIFPSTIILSQDFFHRVGRWVEALGRTLAEDLEFTLRCVTHPPIGVVSTPLVGIRKHPGGFSADHLRTLKGEIEILRYVLQQPYARLHQAAVLDGIARLNVAGADGCFHSGNLAGFREFLNAVPREHRSWTLRMKSLIATLPSKAAEPCRRASLSLAALLRRLR